jgi:hypothetical protein
MSQTDLTEDEMELLSEDEIELNEIADCILEKSDGDDESGAKIRCEVPEHLWEHVTDEPVKEVSFEVSDTTEEEKA